MAKGENQTKKRKELGTPDGGRIGWVVREHNSAESEVLWAEQGTCESNGISEETTNSFGELTAKQKLMLSCHDLTGAWLTVRGDCTFAGGAKICDL